MSTEGEAVQTPVETPVEAPVETPKELTPSQEIDAGVEAEKAKAETPVEPSVPKGVQKRIDRAVRQKYEAEARTKMLEERLAAIESRQALPQNVSRQDDEPRIDQYDNFDKYVAAKAEYIAKRQIEQTLTEREQRQNAERAATERSKTVGKWNQRVEKATAEMPDFEEVVSTSTVPMTEPMQLAIMESDVGPKLAYYLANNPVEAVEIAGMSPSSAIRTLGRIEERLSKPVEKRSTNAPAPLTHLGSSAKVSKDPSEMSQKEFETWRRSVIKAR